MTCDMTIMGIAFSQYGVVSKFVTVVHGVGEGLGLEADAPALLVQHATFARDLIGRW